MPRLKDGRRESSRPVRRERARGTTTAPHPSSDPTLRTWKQGHKGARCVSEVATYWACVTPLVYRLQSTATARALRWWPRTKQAPPLFRFRCHWQARPARSPAAPIGHETRQMLHNRKVTPSDARRRCVAARRRAAGRTAVASPCRTQPPCAPAPRSRSARSGALSSWSHWHSQARAAYLVVHEQAVVQVKRVVGCVAHEAEQRLVAARVDGRVWQLHAPKHAPHRVRDELAAGGKLVMLLARHLHHAAPLRLRTTARVSAPLGMGSNAWTVPRTISGSWCTGARASGHHPPATREHAGSAAAQSRRPGLGVKAQGRTRTRS